MIHDRECVQNVRNGEKVTVSHPYADLLCVTMADPETFVISFVNDVDLTYVSPVNFFVAFIY